MKDIVLFGIQGAGKGTQAQKIIQAFPGTFAYLSTGDVFRALCASPNAIGDYLKDMMATGQLIPDEVTIAVFDVYYKTLGTKAMLLDGYPRSKAQVDDLLTKVQKEKRNLIGINFVLDEKTAIARMLARGRSDDNEVTIKKRLQEYYTKTQPIVAYFGEYAKLVDIDASRSIDAIFADVYEVIKS